MEITPRSDDRIPLGTDALVILCAPGEERLAREPLDRLDALLDGHLHRHVERHGFRGRRGQKIVLDTLGRLEASELCLLGTGKPPDSAEAWFELGLTLGAHAKAAKWTSLALMGVGASVTSTSAEPLVRGLLSARYRFRRHVTRDPDEPEPASLTAIHLLGVPTDEVGATARALADVDDLQASVDWCRDLVNEAPGRCTPTALGREAAGRAVERGLEAEVLDRAACESLGLGFLLAVAQGSAEPPVLIHLWHRPAEPRGPRVVLVGKGITFDSGGLSLKNAEAMKEMKNDMAGGAAVLAAMCQLPRMNLPLEVHALVPACENMPSGRAYKLGDVIRGLDGPSVEIVNTDAEGRLVLADGLAYARRLGAEVLVDLATLTGACVVALGEHTAGLFGTDDGLATLMLDAAGQAGESLFRLPLTAALEDQLKSEVADCKNAGGRWGGAITAALFLKKFTKDVPWLHLDIAGPAYRSKAGGGRAPGATGFGVATLVRFFEALASHRAEPGRQDASGRGGDAETSSPEGGDA